MWDKYKKKPLEVKAIQFTFENKQQVFNDITCNKRPIFDLDNNPVLILSLPEGEVNVTINDWIIKDGEIYSSCKPSIFDKMFDKM